MPVIEIRLHLVHKYVISASSLLHALQSLLTSTHLIVPILQEFEEHACEKDRSKGLQTRFELPYKIDGDKVGNHTIKIFFNKEEAWTKALKFMATDLKFALKWVVVEHDKALAASLTPQLAASRAGSATANMT